MLFMTMVRIQKDNWSHLRYVGDYVFINTSHYKTCNCSLFVIVRCYTT